MAIDRDVLIGFRPRSDGQVHVHSLDLDADISEGPWARPVTETIRLLVPRATRPFAGFDAAITSTVPIGAGLSSSAAFDVAVAIVTATVAGLRLDPVELALVAQEVEQIAERRAVRAHGPDSHRWEANRTTRCCSTAARSRSLR